MRVVLRKGNKTYKGKDGKEHNYFNYFLECDNGKRILIKPVLEDDYARLNMVAEYER